MKALQFLRLAKAPKQDTKSRMPVDKALKLLGQLGKSLGQNVAGNSENFDADNHLPILRLYSWKPSAISIGRNQSFDYLINQEIFQQKPISFK